jgi:hypothetical protein
LTEYRSWDSGYINDFAATMYKDMATYLERDGCHVGKEKTARRARVIAHLLVDDEARCDEAYNKLVSEWWASRKESPHKFGTIMVWDSNPSLEKKMAIREKIRTDCSNHRKELLLTYLSKYHTKIWD